MNSPHASHFRSSIGVVVQGSAMWFSELVSYAMVGGLVLFLVVLGTVILRSNRIVSAQATAIAHLRTEQDTLSVTLLKLQQRERIVRALAQGDSAHIPGKTLLQLADLVYANSTTYGYDPLLVLAVIRVESYFDAGARGQFQSGELSGALGLMQLKFETARGVAADLGITLDTPEDLFKPEVNLVLGIAYLTQLIKQFKSLKLGILAYNQGPGVVLESIKTNSPLPRHYYDKVIEHYYRLKRSVDKRDL